MTVSAIRTIVVSPPPSAYGVLMAAPTLRWPVAQPADNLDYSLDLSAILGDVSDSVAEVVLDIMPSGSGELAALDLAVNGNVVTAQLSGGVAGRSYTVREKITGVSGRAWQYLVQILIDPDLAASPLPTPPNAGFGTPISWTSGVTMFGPAIVNVGVVAAAGGSQPTAAILPAQTNIINAGAAGTGVLLPAIASLVSGSIRVININSVDEFVYPTGTDAIGSNAAGAPVVVTANTGSITFTIVPGSAKWAVS